MKLPVRRRVNVSLNVLLVEYRPDLLQTRAAILHSRGYNVIHCVERHSAVLACGSSPFDVAVLGPSIPIEEARRLEWDLRTINPELKVLSVGEWDNIGLDEIHKPEFLLQLLDGLVQPQRQSASL
jgi:DNA-binding NtrC family response regulator